jgi:uncharacterized protein (DUF779 family)
LYYDIWPGSVIDGSGGDFPLETPEGKAFHTRSRVLTAQELENLNKTGL